MSTEIIVGGCDQYPEASTGDSNQSSGSLIIAPGATEIVDTVSDLYRCARYFLCVTGDSAVVSKTMEVKIYRSDTESFEQVHNRNSRVNIEVYSQIVANEIRLTVKNNELVSINLGFIKEFI